VELIRGDTARPSHVVNEALQASAIACGYADRGVEAHASVRGDAGRGLGVCAPVVGIDAIPEAPPALTALIACRDARVQRRRGEVCEEWLLPGEHLVFAAICTG